MTRKKSKKAEAEKSYQITLAELAAHDDVCSDALIDNAYYKAQIRKNRPKYNPLRGIKEDEVQKILLKKVIHEKDYASAEEQLLAIAGVERYRRTLKSKPVQENFLRHFRKYIDMYKTDCPWEVSATNRYTITTFEAAVTARARVKDHQTIPYLVGTLVRLTADESEQLDTTNRNFSIVCLGRKKNQSIFLGPARFANHDCNANARLVPKGDDSMEVISLRNIDIGEEITVSYGDDYFGPGNIDCLCASCEISHPPRNGWARRDGSHDTSEAGSPASLLIPSSTQNSMKRKRDSESATPRTTLHHSHKRQRMVPSPSKLQQAWTPPDTSDSDPDIASLDEPDQGTGSPDELAPTPPSNFEKDNEPADQHTNGVVKRKRGSSGAASFKQQRAADLNARLQDELREIEPALPSPLSQASDHDDTIVVKLEATEATKIQKGVPTSYVLSTDKGTQDQPHDEAHAISTITTTEILRTRRKSFQVLPSDLSTVIPSIESTEQHMATTTTITIQPLSTPIQRVPGDWILTRRLLAQPHDRWVQCLNTLCHGLFLQPNGYQTRRECPRCERHSILYGFAWPKTDPNHRKIMERPGKNNKEKMDKNVYSAYRRHGKQGRGNWVEGVGDEEERTLDHRTIHRFVAAEDERTVTRRGLLEQAEQERQGGEGKLLILLARERSVRASESEAFERESMTPDGAEIKRRSRRIIREKIYTDH